MRHIRYGFLATGYTLLLKKIENYDYNILKIILSLYISKYDPFYYYSNPINTLLRFVIILKCFFFLVSIRSYCIGLGF